MALPIPPSPGQRIPNGPFFYPEGAYLPGPLGPLIVGAGIYIDNLTGTISAGGGGGGGITTILPGVGIFVSANVGGIVTVTNTGVINLNPGPGIGISPGVGGSYTITNTLPASPASGTVTSVATGPGLTGGPITTTGTIDLANSGVSPGTYSNPTITVDAYGRITLATPGSSFAGGILATSPLAVTSTFPQTVSIAASSTAQAGAVQLNDTTNSTSVTQAATANSVKTTYDLASQAQTDAANAAASAAVATGQAASAQSAANTANSNAATALATALNAQNDATTALATASAAQSDAATALANSAAAQGTATTALLTAGQKISCSSFTGKGQLLAGTGASVFTALNPGVNGQVLAANSACASGLEWLAAATGSVTTIFTGVGLAGGPISTSGTISLANTTVTPGSYTNANITVDAQGRLTSAVNGVAGGVTQIVAGTNVTLSPVGGTGVVTINATAGGAGTVTNVATGTGLTGGPVTTTGTIALADTAVAPGSYTLANITVDQQGRITAAASGAPPTGGTVTNVATGTGLTGGPITNAGTIALADTTVSPGPYTYGSFTVDQQGRLTAAASGTSPVTAITAGTGLSGGTITSTGTVALANTSVSAGSYTNTSLTVDAQGRLTAAASGVAPITAITGTAPINVTAGTTPVVSISAGTTSASGAVQLFDGVNSTSTALALTAAQGKVLQDQITTLLTAPGIDFAGTIDASTGLVLSVTTVGTTAGYTVGAVLPAASATTVDTYAIVTSPGTFTPPGGSPTAAGDGDWFLVSETSPGVYAWQFLNVGFDAPYASTSAAGIVCLSTNALAQTGTDTLTAITPSIGAATYVFNSDYAAKGDILSATAANTPTALTVGTNGQFLVACAAAATGLCWLTLPAVANATPTVAGVVLGCTNATNAALGCNAFLTGTGDDNVAVGKNSLTSTTTGYQNVAVGLSALCSVTDSLQNTAVGSTTLCSFVTGGCANDAFGALALSSLTSGCYNAALGAYSLFCYTSGSFNTAVGHRSMTGATTGGCNTALGYLSGKNITTGTQNVSIGYDTTVANPAGACQLAIGYAAGQNWLTGDSSKNIQPGAGVKDCDGSVGTAGQYLCSTGAALKWVTGMGDTPVGSVQYFAMSSAPLGWLVADGSAVSRTTYASLFAAIGTVYGAGNGTTTFNLPDLKGQFLRGWNSTGTGCDPSRVFGSTQGSALGSHCHDVTVVSGGAGRPEWLFPNTACPLGATYPAPQSGGGAVRTAGFTSTVGSTETRPTNVAMLPCIKWQVTTAPSSCGIPCACITGKGALVTGTAADSPVAIPVGTDGQALVACAACPTGLTWTTPAVPVSPATPTAAGIVLGCTITTCTALGCNALLGNTGTGNSALGVNALSSSATGDNNTAIGACALCSNTTGVNNTAIGSKALIVTTTGNFNVGVGRDAMLANTTGCYNVAIGYTSSSARVSGSYNVSLGTQTFFSATAGDYNVAVGSLAGGLLTTGTRNVAIGPNANVTLPAGDCQLAIGFANAQNWLTGDSSKNIQPGAGIKDCTGSVGGPCQYLVSTGTALQWITPPSTNYRQCVAGCFTTPASALCQIAGVSLTTSGNPVQLNAYGDAYSSGSNWYGCVFIRRCGSPNVDTRSSWLENNAGNLNEAFALSYIDNPPAGTYCYALMMCVPSGSGGNVIAGEAGGPVFNAVELGTVAPGMFPSWTSAGTIQSVGWSSVSGTAVVPSTVSRNNVSYRQLGPKDWEVTYSFTSTATFTNLGSGDWLFTLPNSLQFNTTLPWQRIENTAAPGANQNWRQYFIPTANEINIAYTNSSNANIYGSGIVPYDATRFRIFATDGNNSAPQPIDNGYWGGASSVLLFTASFQFTSL